MQFLLPAIVSNSRSRMPGDFVLVDGGQGIHPAMFVHNGQNSFILDFESKLDSGGTHFAIYRPDSFREDRLLHVENARIVPSLASEDLRMGRPEAYQRSKVLYLTESGPVVHAFFMRSSPCINLSTGDIATIDTDYEMHTKKWRIEVGIGDGRYQTLAEFTA